MPTAALSAAVYVVSARSAAGVRHKRCQRTHVLLGELPLERGHHPQSIADRAQDALVLALLEQETLNEKELAAVFAPVRKRDPRPVWHSSPSRPVSSIPPIDSPAEVAAGTEGGLPQDQAADAGSESFGTGQNPPGGAVDDPAGGVS